MTYKNEEERLKRKERYQKNKEQIKIQNKNWRDNNKEKCREYEKKREHSPHRKLYKQKYNKVRNQIPEVREKQRIWAKEYNKKPRVIIQKTINKRRYTKKHRVKLKIRQRVYRKNNLEKVRLQSRNRNKNIKENNPEKYAKILKKMKIYAKSENGKKSAKKGYLKYYATEKGKAQYRKNDKIFYKTIRGKFNVYKKQAKKRNYDFNLTFEVFSSYWKKDCSYCGDKIEYIGLDRVDNTMGYEIDNIVPCCAWCNRMKLQYTKKEFLEKIMRIYKKNEKQNKE